MYYLLSRTWLFGCAMTGQTGNPRVQQLPPTQAVNSHSKVTSSEDIEGNIILIWKLLFYFVSCENCESCKHFPLPYLQNFSGRHLIRGFKLLQ